MKLLPLIDIDGNKRQCGDPVFEARRWFNTRPLALSNDSVNGNAGSNGSTW
jgi:hypothetical protein